MAKVRISAVSYKAGKIDSFQDLARHCTRLVAEAAAYGPDFVVFPEMFTGELMTFMGEEDLAKAYEGVSGYTEQYRELFGGLAQEHGFYIIAGSHLVKEAGKLYNTAHVFTPQGDLWQQRKMHLTPIEKHFFAPGDGYSVFETEKARFGIVTCYDCEFPEAARLLALKGAEILFSPSATLDEQGYWRVRHCAHARCIEDQLYAVHCSLVGDWGLPGLEWWGMPSILSPCDRGFPAKGIVAEGPANQESVICAEVDTDLLYEIREAGAVVTLKDIRWDLCRELADMGPGER